MDTFWKHHCHAVWLFKQDPVDISVSDVTRTTFVRILAPLFLVPVHLHRHLIDHQHKPATCTWCHTVMYPGPTSSLDNHKRGYCSDRVKQGKDGPIWPQPHG